jgi:Bacterial extracellular solute-binding proteins, family 5 Middle
MLLMHNGIAQSQTNVTYKPTKRGGGGALKVLWWQGATLLQPHFANGTKDQEGSRIFYESLACWDTEGNLIPILAAEIPSVENGGLLPGGKVVRWRLKQGVTWHDGKPFTADDCVFTWEFARDPASACVTMGVYKDVTVTKVDSHTIVVSFQKPTPFWATAFVAAEGMIIPKHLFGPYAGAKSRDAPNNLKPVGTGPYKFVDFKPGDMVRGEINTSYHMPNRPYFDTIEMKGGGDATSAARAVLQTGEYDYAWNLQVEDEILRRMEDSGKGRVYIVPSGDIEFLQLNPTDPHTEVEGERASPKSKHFAFSDPAVREAMSLVAAQHQARVQHRQGGPAPRGSGLEEGFRRCSREGRQEAEVRLPDLGEFAAPEGAGGDQARRTEGRHRPRTEVGHRVGVLLLRRRQPRHLRQVLGRHPDVHHHHDAARSRAFHGPVHLVGGFVQGQQMARPQHLSLGQRRVRQDLPRRRGRARPGEAGRPVHQDERSAGEGQRGDPADQPAARARRQRQARDAAVGLGPRSVRLAQLVPRGLSHRCR